MSARAGDTICPLSGTLGPRVPQIFNFPIQLPNPGLLISAAAFRINWKNLQQQVALPCGAYYTINGNSATIDGGEIEIAGHVSRSLQIRVGADFEKTDITDPGALGIVGVTPGSRILGVPAWTASLGGVTPDPSSAAWTAWSLPTTATPATA
jgi:outer membrane receptor protein involved in Fe transport